MGRNGSVVLAAFFACLLFALPASVRAQRVQGPVMSAPRVTPMRAIAPVGVRPVRPIAVSRARVPRPGPAIVPMRRLNGVRVNGEQGLDRTTPRGSDVASQRAEDQFGAGLGFGAPADLEQLLNITPTNGFNWQYINAINQDLPLKAIVDPVTRLEIAQAEHLLRVGGGQFSGAYVLGGGYGYYVPEETAEGQTPPAGEEAQTESGQQPQTTQPRVIVLQQKVPRNQVQESTPPTVPSEGEFTLVLRDGTKIDAIAFTRADGEIVYITPDGDRKTIGAGDLDSAATERLNQERGTPLQLSGS
jgi:hypothetical protein